jgi:hypothetical protein
MWRTKIGLRERIASWLGLESVSIGAIVHSF